MTDEEIVESARGIVLSWLAEWALMLRVDQTPDQRGLDAHNRIAARHVDALLDIRRELAESWGWLPPPAPFPFQERDEPAR